MPTSAGQLRAKLADRNANPVQTVASPSAVPGASGLVVTLDLTFQGVQFKPEDLFDALESKYGAGRISSDREQSRGALNFRIS